MWRLIAEVVGDIDGNLPSVIAIPKNGAEDLIVSFSDDVAASRGDFPDKIKQAASFRGGG